MNARIELSKLGWSTNDRLSDLGWGGGFGYSLWADRWDWHGVRLGGAVCFYTKIPPQDVNESSVRQAEERLLERCKFAWDNFRDCIPCQAIDGSVVRDDLITGIINKVHERNVFADAVEATAGGQDAN